MTCNEALCPECFMDSHVGHERKNLKKLYEEKKRTLLDALELYQNKIDEIDSIDAEMKEEMK